MLKATMCILENMGRVTVDAAESILNLEEKKSERRQNVTMIYWYENKIERDEQKLKIKQKIIPEDIGGKKYFATNEKSLIIAL